MKYRHSDKSRVSKLLIFSGIFIVILIFFIVYLFLPDGIYLFNDKKGVKDNTEELYYTTKQVIDYETGKYDSKDIWEVRFEVIKSRAYLYKNEEKIKEVTGSNLKSILFFSPESFKSDYELEENNKTGIIYEIPLKESEEYVSSLLSRGYTLRRKILTSNYAEVYLLDTVGNTVRILSFKDKMLVGTLFEGVLLPDIESYF